MKLRNAMGKIEHTNNWDFRKVDEFQNHADMDSMLVQMIQRRLTEILEQVNQINKV